MDNRFRSAAFGGFNRQDVMDYLERAAKEHDQQMEELRARLDQAQQETAQLRDQLTQAQEQARQARAELEQNTADRQNAQEQSDLLVQTQEELTRLRGQIARLEPDAVAYAAIKERTAGIELEAHRRAQAIVDEAQAQVEQLHREQALWLERVERDYYDLRAQVGTTVTQAASEMERVRQGLDNISLCMNNQHSALERLMQTAKSDSSAKKD
ncbi:MAG: hypothetical protein IKB79_07370 [Oscillospiraceae bacterium]|nr:hypothetical protein [Oscillospiraceae bacterium]